MTCFAFAFLLPSANWDFLTLVDIDVIVALALEVLLDGADSNGRVSSLGMVLGTNGCYLRFRDSLTWPLIRSVSCT